jgi:hypothetical protein
VPPLQDTADLRFYTVASLRQHAMQFDGNACFKRSFVFFYRISVLRAFLNGCIDRGTVRIVYLFLSRLFSPICRIRDFFVLMFILKMLKKILRCSSGPVYNWLESKTNESQPRYAFTFPSRQFLHVKLETIVGDLSFFLQKNTIFQRRQSQICGNYSGEAVFDNRMQ